MRGHSGSADGASLYCSPTPESARNRVPKLGVGVPGQRAAHARCTTPTAQIPGHARVRATVSLLKVHLTFFYSLPSRVLWPPNSINLQSTGRLDMVQKLAPRTYAAHLCLVMTFLRRIVFLCSTPLDVGADAACPPHRHLITRVPTAVVALLSCCISHRPVYIILATVSCEYARLLSCRHGQSAWLGGNLNGQ